MDRIRTLFRAAALVVLASLPAAVQAQETGRVIGRIVDAAAGAPIAGAQVEVTGTAIRAVSAVDGRYTLPGAPAGPISVSARFVGYQPKTVTGLVVPPNGMVEQNIALTASVVQLEEVAVTAETERGTVAAALEEQRYSPQMVNAITSEQISKSPDSDAGAAVQRVSGVSVQDGKFVFVRGLGERYTTASLNGSRIPSPEPEKRQVPFDLFPSNLIEGITTSKTFTPDQPGDFSGGQVNIKTKEFPSQRKITFSAGTGVNTFAVGSDRSFAPTASGDFVADGAVPRALPSIVSRTDFTSTLTPQQTNEVVNSFRNVWSTRTTAGTPNAAFNMSLGGTDRFLGQEVGYIASGSYGYNADVQYDQYRGLAIARADGKAEQSDLYLGETGRYSVLWGGILNLTTNIGSHSQISFNNNYNRTMDNEGRFENGFSENLATDLTISRLRYVQRAVFSTQLTGLHSLGQRHQLKWAGTFADINRKEPDRSEMVYAPLPTTGELGWYGVSNEAAVRTFGDLQENNGEGRLDYTYFLGNADGRASVQVGGLFRHTSRDATNDVYSISLANSLAPDQLALAPEQIFDGRFSSGDQTSFRVVPLGQGGSYDARENITAGFAMLTLPLTARLQLIGGARVENWDLTVNATPTLGATETVLRNQTDVLPALALTYALTEEQNLRFAVSRTLSRPEYRELAEVQYRDVIGGDNIRGNRDLVRSTIDNVDVRWEFFPTPSEVLSVTAFYKHFTNPIERVYLATSGTRIITFVNASGADNVGVELEARKSLGFLGRGLRAFTGFANATLMSSQIRIDNASEASITDTERRMVGQAPYVVNLGTTYTSASGAWSGTLLYNVIGDRIVEAGEVPLPNVEEKPRHMIDFSLRFPVVQNLSGSFNAKNILNAPYRRFQGDVVRERYLTGRILSIGFTWGL